MAGFFYKLFGSGNKIDFRALIDEGAILLDVRTKEEYKQGSCANSINIPLDKLKNNLSKLRKNKPIIAVCASGMRSRSAVSILRSEGFSEVHNGGCWLNY